MLCEVADHSLQNLNNLLSGCISCQCIFLLFFRLYDVVKIGYAFAMFLTYFLQFYVPMQILVPSVRKKCHPKARNTVEYVFRAAMVILTCMLPICTFILYMICVAQWIGRVTPNVISAGSIPTVKTKKLTIG